MNAQTMAMLEKGQIPQALAIAKLALEKAEKEHGAGNVLTVESLKNLALANQAKGNFIDAESFYKKAIDILQKAKGPDNIDVSKLLNNMAGLYYSQGDYDKAVNVYQQTLAIVASRLPDDDPIVQTVRKNISICETKRTTQNNASVSPGISEPMQTPADSAAVKDMVPEEIKKYAMDNLAKQNIFIAQLKPISPVVIADKGIVFPYHCISKTEKGVDKGAEIILLFAAIKNPDKQGAYIFQQTRIVSYASYMEQLKKGGQESIRQSLIQAFPDLYS